MQKTENVERKFVECDHRISPLSDPCEAWNIYVGDSPVSKFLDAVALPKGEEHERVENDVRKYLNKAKIMWGAPLCECEYEFAEANLTQILLDDLNL